MKYRHLLLLMRHAKSSWKNEGLSDRQRPLNRRGERAARTMADRIAGLPYRFESVIASPAVRTMVTAQIVADGIGLQGNVVLDETLYMAGKEALVTCIEQLPETKRCVMIVGHNPSVEEAAEAIAGFTVEKFPTAAYVLIGFNGPWSQTGKAELVGYDYPKSQE